MDILEEIKSRIETAIPNCVAEANGGGGHFNIVATSKEFEGKSLLKKQQMVLMAIADLMKGDNAPVHAVDSIKTHF